ncbi:unnamed protein product [Sphagnum balticum]
MFHDPWGSKGMRKGSIMSKQYRVSSHIVDPTDPFLREGSVNQWRYAVDKPSMFEHTGATAVLSGDKKEEAHYNLNELLRKLGLKSAKTYWPGTTLSMEDLERTMNQAIANFGMPEQILMNPDDFNNLRNWTKK